jgi:hypothetical protein
LNQCPGKSTGVLLSTVFDKNIRHKKFSKRLHKKNALEGFTVAYIDLESDKLVNCHVDLCNCRGEEYNSLIIASRLLAINGAEKRVTLIGYMRKSITTSKRENLFHLL